MHGTKSLVLLSRISINNLHYSKCGTKLFLGSDSRILFLDEYYGKEFYSSLEIGNRFSTLCAKPNNLTKTAKAIGKLMKVDFVTDRFSKYKK